MADELSTLTVEQYTQGRLHRDDPETVRVLAAALGVARRYCGWHVTPELSTDHVLDGPCSSLLVLPTLRLKEITTLSEDGVVLDVTLLETSPRGLVRKASRYPWSGKFAAIEVTMVHGFDDAGDWTSAVLSLVDRWSQLSEGGQPTVIGPFQYGVTREAAGSAFTDVERFLLDSYALEKAP